MVDWSQAVPRQQPVGGYAQAQQWIGYGRDANAAKLNDYLYNGGRNLSIQDRAWCADFVNRTLQAGGQQGTGSGMARSFLGWGKPTQQPQVGDIAVFSRGDPNGPTGHVGYYQGLNPDGSIRVLGGNQGGRVSVATFPRSQLLGFRTAGANAFDDGTGGFQKDRAMTISPGAGGWRDAPPMTGEAKMMQDDGAGWRDTPPMQTARMQTPQTYASTFGAQRQPNAFVPATWGQGGEVTWSDGTRQSLYNMG